MQTTANNNLVFTDSCSLKRLADLGTGITHGEFYQQLATRVARAISAKPLFQDWRRRLSHRLNKLTRSPYGQ